MTSGAWRRKGLEEQEGRRDYDSDSCADTKRTNDEFADKLAHVNPQSPRVRRKFPAGAPQIGSQASVAAERRGDGLKSLE